MKKSIKPLFIIIGILLIIIAIIIGIAFLIKNDQIKYDNSILKSDRALLVIDKENIAEEKFLYKKGDRVNIILKDSTTNYDYAKKPYMENVKISEINDDSLTLWVPFAYKSFITAMQKSPLITIEIEDATDQKGAFKANKELHKLLEEKYSLTPNKAK